MAYSSVLVQCNVSEFMMDIPEFDFNGNLPPGEHSATWSELVARYGYNQRRLAIVGDLKRWLVHVQAAGCRTAWIDGSFVCAKESPGDYDACWDLTGVDYTLIAPCLLNRTEIEANLIKKTFGGDIRPDRASPPASIQHYFKFYQSDRDGRPKGIVRLDLRSLVF